MSAPMTLEKKCEAAQKARAEVLFVCTGNTCRSPMAAALYNALREGEDAPVAYSAGLFAAPGQPISENALLALQEAGVEPIPENDYTAHRARTVTREMMERAERVIAISASHAMQLTLRFPDMAGKIETLPMDIADPFGGDLAVYRACLMQLRYCLMLCKGDRDAKA